MPNIQKPECPSLLELDSKAAPSCFVSNLLNLYIFKLKWIINFHTGQTSTICIFPPSQPWISFKCCVFWNICGWFFTWSSFSLLLDSFWLSDGILVVRLVLINICVCPFFIPHQAPVSMINLLSLDSFWCNFACLKIFSVLTKILKISDPLEFRNHSDLHLSKVLLLLNTV